MREPYLKVSKIIFSGIIIILFLLCLGAKFLSYAVTPDTKFALIEIETPDYLSSGYSLFLILDHQSLVENSLSLANGDDIRLFYDKTGQFQGGEKELDLVLDEASSWNQIETKLWFKLQDDLPGFAINDKYYRLYYGVEDDTRPLREKKNVYYFFDDFGDGILNDWEHDSNGAIWKEEDGLLKSENNGAQIKKTGTDISGYLAQVEIKKINSNQYVGLLGRLVDFSKFYLYSRDRNAHDWRLNRNYNEQWNTLAVNDGQSEPKSGNIISLKIVEDNIVGYLNDQKVVETKDNAISEGTVGLFTNGENSATEFDNFIIRKVVNNEPVVNIVWDSITPSSTITPTETLTPTPTITPTPTYIIDNF